MQSHKAYRYAAAAALQPAAAALQPAAAALMPVGKMTADRNWIPVVVRVFILRVWVAHSGVQDRHAYVQVSTQHTLFGPHHTISQPPPFTKGKMGVKPGKTGRFGKDRAPDFTKRGLVKCS
jgi:hypothetical protein